MEQQPGRRDPVDPSQYDLLGFVLGALDADEHAKIAAALQQHSELREAVDRLYASLPKTADTWSSHRPPAGLARRTCERAADFDRTRELLASLPPKTKLSSASLAPSRSGWNWKDLVAGAVACMSLSLLLLPAIASSRQQARIGVCQNNLRQVSNALQHYTEVYAGLFPSRSAESPLGVAGALGPIMKDASLIEDQMLVCPSSELAKRKDFSIPSCEVVCQSTGTTLRRHQRSMGGAYAYTLGYSDKQGWHPPTSQRRPYVMVIADAIDPQHSGAAKRHGNRGQNVLFEDGHYAFLHDCSPHLIGDDAIYVNRLGIVAAGVDPDDTVLAPSGISPFWPVSFPAR